MDIKTYSLLEENANRSIKSLSLCAHNINLCGHSIDCCKCDYEKYKLRFPVCIEKMQLDTADVIKELITENKHLREENTRLYTDFDNVNDEAEYWHMMFDLQAENLQNRYD